MKFIAQIVEVIFNDRPACFQEGAIETIRAWCFVRGHLLYDSIDFSMCERGSEAIEINLLSEQRREIKLHDWFRA